MNIKLSELTEYISKFREQAKKSASEVTELTIYIKGIENDKGVIGILSKIKCPDTGKDVDWTN